MIERGCKYCRNEEPFEQECVEDTDYDYDENPISCVRYEDRYIDETDFRYCPYCGRKLEVE